MSYRRRQFYMPHSLSSNLKVSNFDSALIANYAFITNAFKFSAITFVFFCSSEYFFAKKSVSFWTQSSIINGFWFFNLSIAPFSHNLRTCHANFYLVKVCELHIIKLLLFYLKILVCFFDFCFNSFSVEGNLFPSSS